MPKRIPQFRPLTARDRLPARPRDDDRLSSSQRGYGSAAWQRVRLAVIARDQGACQLCGLLCWGEGEAHVDHIEPKRPGEPAEATPMEGLRLLCRKCHSKHGLKWTAQPRADSSEGDPDLA
jgi:5-methylcytosine-specific restriction endonuclease McrA